MSDWTDTLDARRAGLIEGFHDANSPIDKLDDAEVPATGAQAPDSDAPPPPRLPVDAPTGRQRQPVAKAKPRASSSRATSAKKKN